MWNHLRTDGALGFGKRTHAHLHGGILCRHLFVGDFRKVLAENTRGIRSINVLLEGASIWCTQKVINLAQSGLDMVGLVDGPEWFCIARSEGCGGLWRMPPPRFCIFVQVVVGRPGAKSSTLENLQKKWCAISMFRLWEHSRCIFPWRFREAPFSILKYSSATYI